MNKYILVIIFSVFLCFGASGQDLARLKGESWVRIMENESSINYFKAEKDFSKFKKEHDKEEAKKERARKRQLAKTGQPVPNESHLEDPEESVMMAYVKWSRSMKPFVSSDGSVLPIEQRMKIVQQQNK